MATIAFSFFEGCVLTYPDIFETAYFFYVLSPITLDTVLHKTTGNDYRIIPDKFENGYAYK